MLTAEEKVELLLLALRFASSIGSGIATGIYASSVSLGIAVALGIMAIVNCGLGELQ